MKNPSTFSGKSNAPSLSLTCLYNQPTVSTVVVEYQLLWDFGSIAFLNYLSFPKMRKCSKLLNYILLNEV